ncbi:MAG: hypothetical protein V1899_04035, partial [Planctomycetota bacterium]
MQILRNVLGISLMVALLLASSVRAGDDAPKPKKAWQQLRPERLISDSTFLFLITPDLSKARASFERTALRGLLSEEEISVPILASLAKLHSAYVKSDSTRSESEIRRRNDEVELLKQLYPLLNGQVSLAIEGNLDTTVRLPRFLLIAGMASEDQQRKLNDIMEKHRYSQIIDSRYVDMNDRVGPYDIYRVENHDLGVNEAWAFVENLFIYGQGKRIVEDAVERFSVRNGADTMALHTGYQNAYRLVGRDERDQESLLYLQVDYANLLKRVMEKYPTQKELLNLNLNLNTELDANRPGIALGIQLGDGDRAAIKEKIFFSAAKGRLPVKGNEPCKAVTARFAQNDSLCFFAGQMKFSNYYKSLLQFAAMSGNALGSDLGLDQRLKTVFGANNDAELISKLEMFKGEAAMFVSYVPQSNLKFENCLEVFQCVFAVELDRDVNEVEFKDLMTKIEAATKQIYVGASVAGAHIRYQQEDSVSGKSKLGLFGNFAAIAQSGKQFPFFLSYARMDLDVEAGGPPRKFLLLSDNLNALRKAVMQARATSSSLAEAPHFKDLNASFRESRFCFGLVELARLMDVYNVLLPYCNQSGLNLETMNKLPTAVTLRSHLFSMAGAASMSTDPEGLLLETYSPTGNLTLLAMAGLASWPMII